MKWDPKRFSWCKVLCLLELSRAYQPSNTIHTSKRHRGAASHLAKEDRERLPAVQRNNEGIQTQANLEESRFSECQRPESGGQRISPPTGLKRAAKSTLEWPHKKNVKVLEQQLKHQIRFPEKICGMTWRLSRICEVQRCWADADVSKESCRRAVTKPRRHDHYSFNSGSGYHVCCEMDASWWQVITPAVSSVLASFSSFFYFFIYFLGGFAQIQVFWFTSLPNQSQEYKLATFPRNHR